MSDMKGNIYKQFPIQHIHFDQFEDIAVEFPGDFEKARSEYSLRQDCKRMEKEKRIIMEKQKRKADLMNLWHIRKALNSKQPVYAVCVDLCKYDGDDVECVGTIDGYPKYFTDKDKYETSLKEARSLEVDFGYQHDIYFGTLGNEVTWQTFIDDSLSVYDILDACNVESKEHEYQSVGDDAVIVIWSWQTYCGYCRKIEGISSAGQLNIKTEKDLITGNYERTFRPNYSVLLSSDEIKDFCHNGIYDDNAADMIAEELNNGSWKWQNYPIFTPDEIKKRFELSFDN